VTYTEPVKLGVKRFPPIKHGITYSGKSFENGIPKAEDVLYIGAFVIDKPIEAINMMRFWSNKFMHHVTLAYKPPQEVIDLLFNGVDTVSNSKDSILIGTELVAKVYRVIHDNLACVALVDIDVPCRNTYPHITIGTAETVKPVYSNDLIHLHFNNNKEIFCANMSFDVDVRIGIMLK
tara:strand:+ start:283 stop:816 length:534 start_codon:yes stop_codon:yes gene_type:complete